VTRLSRLALLSCAVALAVSAAACNRSSEGGGSKATPISDPELAITASLTGLTDVKTFHIDATLNGSINVAKIAELSGTTFPGITTLSLQGTTLTADVDITKQAVKLTISLPTLMGMKVEVVQVDGYTYTKNSLTDTKWTKTESSGVLPISTPSPGETLDLDKAVNELKSSLEDANMTATMIGTEKVDGRDAYHIAISIPLDTINQYIATEGGSTMAGITVDSASFDYWVYKDTVRPAKLEIAGTSAALGSIDLVVTFTKYDESVTIEAPPASEIK
jgi:hypothetical protein